MGSSFIKTKKKLGAMEGTTATLVLSREAVPFTAPACVCLDNEKENLVNGIFGIPHVGRLGRIIL